MADTKYKKRTSIAIPIGGERTPAELVEMITEALAELEQRDLGLFKNCYLYVTPVNPTDRKNLEPIKVNKPYDCAANNFGV